MMLTELSFILGLTGYYAIHSLLADLSIKSRLQAW